MTPHIGGQLRRFMSTQAALLTCCLLLALAVSVLPLAAGAGETPGAGADDRARADRLCEEADGLAEQGDDDGAQARWEEALDIYRELGLAGEQADVLCRRGARLRELLRYGEAQTCFETAIAAYGSLGLWEQEMNAVFALFWTLQDRGDLRGAEACLERARELLEGFRGENRPAAADALFSLGDAAAVLSRRDEAVDYLEQALAMYEELGDSRGAMYAHVQLGSTLQERDDVPGALRQYEAAAAIAREQSWPQDEIYVLVQMARAAGAIGDRESVVSSYREAVEICRRHRLLKQEVQHTCALAGALREKGEPKEAEGTLERARQLCHELTPERDRAEALRWLAGQEQAFSQDDQAREHREEALAIYQDLGLKQEEARTLCDIGSRLAELGEYEVAQPILQRALAMYRELGLERSHDTGRVLSALATAASTSFRYDEAIDYLEQALAMYEELGDSRSAMHTCRRLGFTLWSWQHHPEAFEQLQEAAAIAGQHSWPKWEAQTLADMASWAVQREDHTRAANLLREAVAVQRKAGMLMEELHTTCSLASVLRKMGKESEGEACLERARTLCREVPAERDLADALRVLAGEELGFSQDDEARQHHEQAIAIYQELGLKEGEADTLRYTGWRLVEAGRFVEAQELLEQSLVIYRDLENKQLQADALNQLGVVAFRLGQYERSRTYGEQCIAVREELGQRETVGCAVQLMNQGLTMICLGDYEKATGFLEEAVAIYQKLGLQHPLADIHLGLAACRVGEYDKAQEHLEKALAAARELGDRHAEGRALGILSMRAMGVGQHRQGLDYAEKAVSVFSRHGPKFREADQLSALGSAAAELGDYDKAWGCFEQAIEIYRKRRFDHAVFSIQLEQAQLRMHQLRLPEARSILDRAGEPLRWGSEHVPAWHLAWGRYYLLSGEADEAVKRFEQAGAAAGADASQLTASHIGLGLAHEALGEWEQAVTAYGRAVELSEDSRSRTPTGERVHFFGARAVCFRRLEAYEGLVRVLHRMDRDEEAFFWSEHSKARVLVEAMARGNHGSQLGLPVALRKQEQDLGNRIAALSSAAREDERSREQLQRVRAEHKALVTRLRRDYPEYASMQYPVPLHADEMSLGPNEVLLAYEVTEPESYLFLIRDGEVEHIYEIKLSRSELTGLVERFRRSFVQVRSAGDLRAFDLAAAEQLYDLLLRPALADIEADEHVLVVPDEAIALVPLEALVVHSDGSSRWRATRWGPAPTGVEYVGDTRVFAYWHSGTTMATVRQLRKDVPGDQVLLVADSVTGAREDGTHPALQTGEGQRVASNAGAPGKLRSAEPDGALDRSPGGVGITNSLRRAYGGQVRLMPGMEATRTVLQQEPLQQYAIIVFAMHGVLSDSSSGRGEPALVLSQADAGPDENGYLTMADVMDLDLRAEIVALIACETGAGELARGEGIMAMSRAFQYAGARSVLVSLWKVEDASSDLLAQAFFEGMAAGRSKLESLHAAHRRLRQSGYEHPFFWAPFVLMGENELATRPQRRAGHLASMPLG